jgi:hypothetical protein
MEANTFLSHEQNSMLPITLSPNSNLKLWLEEESEDEFNDIENEKIIDDQESEAPPLRQRKKDKDETN